MTFLRFKKGSNRKLFAGAFDYSASVASQNATAYSVVTLGTDFIPSYVSPFKIVVPLSLNARVVIFSSTLISSIFTGSTETVTEF